ncbi:hypothetical protein PsYK624_163260 [Phanerochaete sordida]|uniref:Uncharacterized protein n=1 Tax=Phanerochaete sordida TaxID=48140 RepID=A0A9P3LLS3_9APHY|nr:hypothetical protein PsYK624_163260 [Phanerochaete sordida]
MRTSSRLLSFKRASSLESVFAVPRGPSGADIPHIPGRPVHDFYLQCRIAEGHLSQAEKRFHGLTHFTLEDGQTRVLDEPVNHTVPMDEARAAERHTLQALEVAHHAPAAFRPRLLVRAADLHARVHGFTELRLGANDLFAKLHALTESVRFGPAVVEYASDPAECLMALERVLLQLTTTELGNSGEFSQLATSRSLDELIGRETFEALCSVLRRVAKDEALRETNELAEAKLGDAAETRARCKASSEELLRAYEERLQALMSVGGHHARSSGSLSN